MKNMQGLGYKKIYMLLPEQGCNRQYGRKNEGKAIKIPNQNKVYLEIEGKRKLRKNLKHQPWLLKNTRIQIYHSKLQTNTNAPK